jgi:rhamnulose-1-phosphate aldolase/alcohol dehydrogenase
VAYEGKRLIAHTRDDEALLAFLESEKMRSLAALGTSCPDHFLRTKIRPMILESPANLDTALEAYRTDYAAYYERCRRPDSPAMRNPNPSVVLVPGLGMISLGKTKAEARITGEFYMNAIAVMRGAETLSRYTALPEAEAFGIEYWQLEEAKLRRMPPEREFARQIALVTGAAQGIGRATAAKLAKLGACVVLLDLNADKLEEALQEVSGAAGTSENVLGVRCDVTRSDDLCDAFTRTIERFGGLDVAIVSAGNARRGTVADTSDQDYAFQSDLLMRAYFETMREASRIMIRQATGGSIVVVASKNGIAAGSNAAVYSAAKAFELHLARCSAGDLAKHGIRVNAVNPDAVLQGSGIWSDEWRSQTAAALGIRPEELEEHYRKRSLLGVTVTPDDVAEAICWLASEARSSRTTGAVIPVDGGNKEGFPR